MVLFPKHTDTVPVDREPNLQGLREFVRRSDRSRPLHFVGRQPEFKFLRAALDQVKGGSRGSADGLTQLITAAPGAGKSALLRELKEQWNKQGVARMVQLRVSILADRTETFREFLTQLDAKAAERYGVTSIESDTAGFDKVVVAKKSTAEQRTHMPVTVDAVARWLKDRITPVVVLIDEVQNLRLIDKESAVGPGSLLRDVHEGVEHLPIMLVLAGLGDSANVIKDYGLSRLDNRSRIALGPLSAQDMREAAERFFDYFHVRGDARERVKWAEAIADGTGGWAHHLFDSLRSAAQAIADGGGNLDPSLLEQAVADALQHRQIYYVDRTEPLAGMPELLSAVFTAMPEQTGATQAALRKAIRRAYESAPHLGDVMEKGKAFEELLHQGLIHDLGKDRYDCPIPSLRNYVEEFCAARGFPVGAAQEEATARPRARSIRRRRSSSY